MHELSKKLKQGSFYTTTSIKLSANVGKKKFISAPGIYKGKLVVLSCLFKMCSKIF